MIIFFCFCEALCQMWPFLLEHRVCAGCAVLSEMIGRVSVSFPPAAPASGAKSRLSSWCIVTAALSWTGTKRSIASLLHLRHSRGASDTKH